MLGLLGKGFAHISETHSVWCLTDAQRRNSTAGCMGCLFLIVAFQETDPALPFNGRKFRKTPGDQ